MRSSVNQDDPKFSRFLRRLGDQISIQNDIASYEKEERDFESGKAAHMINLVRVIMDLNKIDATLAKSMTYNLQLSAESDVADEIEALERQNLSLEEWRFIEACLHASSGNLFTSVIISRYCDDSWKLVEDLTHPLQLN